MAKEETKKSKPKTTKKSPAKKTTSKTTPSVKKVEKKVESKTPVIIQEENHFGRTIIAAALIIVIFLGGYLGIKYKLNSGTGDSKYSATEDEVKFKKEYEELNGTTRSNGEKNVEITISKENHIVYITAEEAANILDSGTGIIYFGYAACPECRNLAPVLVNAANSSGIEKIYYVNMRADDKDDNDIRDIYTLNDRNRPVRTKEGTEAYEMIQLILANHLKDYVLTTSQGKEVKTSRQRVMAPTIVSVKDGEILSFHEGTVDSHKTQENQTSDSLTKDEETELFNTLTSIFSKYLDSGCQEDGC